MLMVPMVQETTPITTEIIIKMDSSRIKSPSTVGHSIE